MNNRGGLGGGGRARGAKAGGSPLVAAVGTSRRRGRAGEGEAGPAGGRVGVGVTPGFGHAAAEPEGPDGPPFCPAPSLELCCRACIVFYRWVMVAVTGGVGVAATLCLCSLLVWPIRLRSCELWPRPSPAHQLPPRLPPGPGLSD